MMLNKNKRPYDPEDFEPRARLRKNLENILGTNKLSASRVLELCCDVRRVDEATFPALRPSTGAGNAKRHLMRQFTKRSKWLPPYWAEI